MKIVIYGNSGSGKSTLARSYAARHGLPHLDLDEIAWEPSGDRRPEPQAVALIQAFMDAHESWVIEGCYSSLIRSALACADELIFLNPGTEVCQQNCRTRPWEPHKYESPRHQDENLQMLLQWVADYETRTDEFSLRAHREIFEAFAGRKVELVTNEEAKAKAGADLP